MTCFGKQRDVQSDEIGFAKQAIGDHEFRVQFPLGVERRTGPVAIEYAHPEALPTPCDASADAPEADDAERGARDVGTHELVEVPTWPCAGTHPGVTFNQAPGDGHQQSPCKI